MKFVTVLVTRSKSIHVKSLHSILRLNLRCMQVAGAQNEIIYCNDDPYEKSELIQAQIKRAEVDRLLFVDYGVHIDDDSLAQAFEPHEGVGCLVFPGVREGIDWKMFKDNVKRQSKEPVEQMGLHFDTEVGKKISDGIHTVTSTEAKCWLMMVKNARKRIEKVHPNPKIMFQKFKESGLKIHAWVRAKLTITYTHECVSNIMNAAGVKTT